MKSSLAILLLALCSPVLGQQRASDVIQSELIEAPESVAAGRLISIKLPPNLPFTVEPKPENKLSFIDEETGKRAYLILEAKAPGYTIVINYAVVHPTPEERKNAPWDDRVAFDRWLEENSADEVYSDEHFVKVTGKDDKQDDDKKDDDQKDEDDDKPDPKPQPDGPYWIIILEESSERSAETAVILNDADFLKSLSDAGHKWRVYEEDHADAAAFVSLTKDRPALILATLSGEVVKIVPMPKTTQGIRDLLKGGK